MVNSLPAWCGTGIEFKMYPEDVPTKGVGWYPCAYGYDPIDEGLCEGQMFFDGSNWVNPFTEPFVKFIDEAYATEDEAYNRAAALEIGS